MKKYSFLLIGCGRIGKRHAEKISRVGKLAGVCDIDADKANYLAGLYEAPAFGELSRGLQESKADFAVICTPNGLHARQTITCLQSGLHVICEKPMAIQTADCKKMINAATENSRRLFIVKQNRFNPPILAAKKKIEEGAFGKICNVQLNCFWNRPNDYYMESWRGTKDMDGGTLFTQFSHFIDLLYWFMGEVKDLHVIKDNFLHKDVMDFEDTGVIALRFASGATGTINYTVNAYSKNMEGSLTLFGERATVKIGGEYLNRVDYAEGIELGFIENSGRSNDYGTYQGSMSNHHKVYDHLLDVMNNGVPEVLSTHDAMKTVELIERIYSQ